MGNKKYQKTWGGLFMDQVFGTNSKTPYQKANQRREKENRGDAGRWGRAMNKLNKEHKSNRKYYGYDD